MWGISNLLEAACIAGGFSLLLLVAEVWTRLASPKPEYPRKLVHVAGGVGCLLFPFLVQSAWVVLFLAVGMSAIFALGGCCGFLRCLHGVKRTSRGSEYYPIAIFLAYLVSYGSPWLYVAAILVLALADASAAIIGSSYGRIRYAVEDEEKSLEGSLTFFIIAFFAIHLPTLLMTDLSRPVCVLAALLVAVLMTGFEIVSLHGADNLFVPLGVCAILDRITGKPLEEIVYQNLSLLAICLILALLTWRLRTFNVGGTILLVLGIYGCWSLGGEEWALPLGLGTILFIGSWLWRKTQTKAGGIVRVRATSRALLVPFLFLVFANVTRNFGFVYGAFVASTTVAAIEACRKNIYLAGKHFRDWKTPLFFALPLGGSVMVVWLSGIILITGAATIAATLAVTVVASFCLQGFQTLRPRPEFGAHWRASDFVVCLLAGITMLLLQWFQLIPCWRIAG